MPYTPYTDEQKWLANSVDLVEFLRSRGEPLERAGHEYKLIYTDNSGKHDSITIRGSTWFDHKNQVGGGAIRFMQHHYGMDFRAAMDTLLGQAALPQTAPRLIQSVHERHQFKLPEENTDMHRVYAYLIKQRYITPRIITHFARNHTLYEDKAHHNAVFVGLDEKGVPRQAHLRSTSSNSGFRLTCEGSDTRYSFAHFSESDKLFVFEAPIDMLSYLTLHPQSWQQHSYISLNGVYETALLHALDTHENLRKIVLCTDNDVGGIDASDRLADILHERGYSEITRILPKYKDWNECLKAWHGADALPAVVNERKACFADFVDSLQSIKCNPDRLCAQLAATVNNEQYQYLAEYALASSAFFMPEGSFEMAQNRLKTGYRAYRDKETMDVRKRNLQDAFTVAYRDLRQIARTPEQSTETAKKLLCLAECAAKIAVEEEMKMSDMQEEAPEIALEEKCALTLG